MRALPWLRLAGIVLLLLAPARARAVTVRRFFEPTDMEFEDPGDVQLDTQWGLVRGEDAFRVSVPDFELDVGLPWDLELDLDGEMAVGGPDSGELRLDQLAQDNLWTSVKYGILTYADDELQQSEALGVQVGPIWPVAPGAQGVGVDGLVLLGFRSANGAYVVLNGGAFVEPGDASGLPRNPNPQESAADRRATGIAGGVDVEWPLDRDGVWTALGELSGVAYLSSDAPQLTTSLGLQWTPLPDLDLSVTTFRGWLPGGDQYGLLLGVTRRFTLG